MDLLVLQKPFPDAARSAFAKRELATLAAEELAPIVDDRYRAYSRHFISDGTDIYIPYRLHFLLGESDEITRFAAPSRCLLTRSTDGHVRQRALRSLLSLSDEWVIPFVVTLLGEYVIEIAEDIRAQVRYLNDTAYTRFVRQNRNAMLGTRARAVSYWNVYYRQRFPDRRLYPAIAVLDQFDMWAYENPLQDASFSGSIA